MHDTTLIFDMRRSRDYARAWCRRRSRRRTPSSSAFIWRLFGLLAFALGYGSPVAAQTSEAKHDTPVCVDVTVNDQHMLTYDCLNRQLAPPATKPAQPMAGSAGDIVRQPSNQQVGQFNFSAFSERMGSNLGKSAYPQRPPPTQQAPPFSGR